MKIIALGTGTSQGIPLIGCQCAVCMSTDPADKRLRSSIYLETDQTKLLIDIGPDFRTQFLTNDITSVDHVLITHEHNDHIIGLDDIRPINFIQKKSIPVYSYQRVCTDIKNRFSYVFSSTPGTPQIELNTIDDNPFTINDLHITPINVNHGRLPIWGFRINNMAYITDASEIPEIEMEKLKNLDLLIINALRLEKHFSHFNLEESLAVIQKLQPKRSYLTHISHLMGLTADWESTLPNSVSSLKDRMIIHTDNL